MGVGGCTYVCMGGWVCVRVWDVHMNITSVAQITYLLFIYVFVLCNVVCMECGLPLCAVLQVNLSPSFHTDSPLDKDIKDNLLFDALNLMNWTMASKQKCLEEQKKMLEERLLQRQKAKLSA